MIREMRVGPVYLLADPKGYWFRLFIDCAVLSDLERHIEVIKGCPMKGEPALPKPERSITTWMTRGRDGSSARKIDGRDYK